MLQTKFKHFQGPLALNFKTFKRQIHFQDFLWSWKTGKKLQELSRKSGRLGEAYTNDWRVDSLVDHTQPQQGTGKIKTDYHKKYGEKLPIVGEGIANSVRWKVLMDRGFKYSVRWQRR